MLKHLSNLWVKACSTLSLVDFPLTVAPAIAKVHVFSVAVGNNDLDILSHKRNKFLDIAESVHLSYFLNKRIMGVTKGG
uniref:Putative ovule protein n=1 Tax=Solanum chacoense TaxID=4108 RepID=A0A0V0GQI4_SOLCH